MTPCLTSLLRVGRSASAEWRQTQPFFRSVICPKASKITFRKAFAGPVPAGTSWLGEWGLGERRRKPASSGEQTFLCSSRLKTPARQVGIERLSSSNIVCLQDFNGRNIQHVDPDRSKATRIRKATQHSRGRKRGSEYHWLII